MDSNEQIRHRLRMRGHIQPALLESMMEGGATPPSAALELVEERPESVCKLLADYFGAVVLTVENPLPPSVQQHAALVQPSDSVDERFATEPREPFLGKWPRFLDWVVLP
eukprot:1609615-Rhodomonas_salina.2